MLKHTAAWALSSTKRDDFRVEVVGCRRIAVSSAFSARDTLALSMPRWRGPGPKNSSDGQCHPVLGFDPPPKVFLVQVDLFDRGPSTAWRLCKQGGTGTLQKLLLAFDSGGAAIENAVRESVEAHGLSVTTIHGWGVEDYPGRLPPALVAHS